MQYSKQLIREPSEDRNKYEKKTMKNRNSSNVLVLTYDFQVIHYST